MRWSRQYKIIPPQEWIALGMSEHLTAHNYDKFNSWIICRFYQRLLRYCKIENMWLDSSSKWVLSRFSNMDRLSWYALICGSVFVLWLFFYGTHRALNSRCRRLTTSFILRHLIYPYLFPRVPFMGTSTRYKAFMVFLYLLTNTLVITIGNKAKIESRSATMSIINLIPLLCGSRLSLATRLFGISFRTSVNSHQWLGRTAIAQMLVHTVVMARHSPFEWTTKNITGTVVGTVKHGIELPY